MDMTQTQQKSLQWESHSLRHPKEVTAKTNKN
jgi:hypothetical protein